MDNTTKTLIGLVVLAMADTITPIPVIGAILMYIVLARPAWFLDLVREIYQQGQ